ncbi:MAG: potassium transporter TrkG [Nonlabens sp.]
MIPYLRSYNRFLLSLSPQRNLVYGFLVYNTIGFLLLCLPWFHNGDNQWIDNLFASTSAISTTGLLTVGTTEYFTTLGQMVLMLLFQIGGIGYMTFTTYILLSSTHKASNWRKKVMNAAFSIPDSLDLKDFIKSAVVFTISMEILGVILFYIGFMDEGWGFWETLWHSIFHSISAFCTAGFSLFGNGFEDFVGNGMINFAASLLAIGGSLGFIVFTDLWLWIKNKKHSISFTTRVIFIGFAVLLTFGTLNLYFNEPAIMALEGATRFYAAFFQSMSAMTTVGFNTIPINSLILPSLFAIIFLMYVGASPSGTSGGLKITTFTTVIAYLRSKLKACDGILFFGRRIPQKRVDIALTSFIFYITIIFFGLLLLTNSENIEFRDIMFETLSALGTVGLSTGVTGELTFFGKCVIIALMFIGRLGVITFGLALSRTSVEEDTEEEDIAV